MAGYKNCHGAKTAEEYLLKCLFAAEEERDKAVFYAEFLKIAEENRIKQEEESAKRLKEKIKNAPIFSVRETKTVSFKVESLYYLVKPEYNFNDINILSNILEKDDDKLYEWASKTYEPIRGSYLSSLKPISRKEKTYDYTLEYMEDENIKKTYVSEEWYPQDFVELKSEYFGVDSIYPLSMEEEVKKEAIKKLRESLQDAIDKLKSE